MKTKSHASRLSAFSFSAFSFFFLASAAFAADTTTSSWNGTTSTDWATAGNWITVVPSTTVSAKFDRTFTSGRQPTLGAAATTQGIWLATGDTQDVLINSTTAYALTITGNATLNSMANAGIYMNDSANHNLTIGSNTSITLSNATGFYNQQTAGNLAISGGLNLNAKVLTIGANATSTGNVTISGNISGTTGAIVINSGGIVTLSGTNTYTGNTTLTLGTLKNGSANTFTGKGMLIVNGGTFDLSGNNANFLTIANGNATGTITDSTAGSGTTTLTFGAGAGTSQNSYTIATLIKDGANGQKVAVVAATNASNASLFALTSANTFSGGLTLTMNGTTAGNLRINSLISTVGSAGAITSSPFGTGAITLGTVATDKINILMDTVGSNTLANALIFNTATGLGAGYPGFRIESAGNTLSGNITAALADATFSAYTTSGSATLTGQIGGTYGLYLMGHTATQTLNITLNNSGAANNYGGNTTVSQYATLTLGRADQIPNGSGTGNVTNNGTIALGGFNETINGLSGNGTVDGTSGTPILTIGDNNATSTFSGNIINTAGTLALTKIGSGTLTLSGTNSYTGNTTIAGYSSLSIATTSALPGWNVNGRYAVQNGGTLAVYNAVTDSNIATMLSTTNFAAGAALGFDTTTANRTYSIVLANTAQGALGLTVLGSNTLTLDQANTYTGVTTLTAGTLSVATIGDGGVAGNLGQAGNASTNIVFNGGNLSYTGANATSDRAFTIVAGKTATINTTNNISFAGATGATTTGGLIKTGSGILTLSGVNTYTGVTTLTAGTLSVATIGDGGVAGNLGQAGNASTNIVFNGGNLSYTGANATSDRAFTIVAGKTATINTTNNISFAGATGATTTGGLTVTGSGILTLSGVNNYTGTTTIDQSSNLKFTADQSLGALTFGVTAGGASTTATTLDLTSANATFSGALLVQNNSSTSVPATITIGSGKTLTTQSTVNVGYNGSNNSGYSMAVTGASGTWNASTAASGVVFWVGGGTTSGVKSRLDMSGLGTFNGSFSNAASVFRIGDNPGASSSKNDSYAILAATSTITVGTLGIGDKASEQAGSSTNYLYLGNVTNTINANTITIGTAAGSGQGSGSLQFNTGTGTVKIRAQDTTNAAALNLLAVNSSNSTAASVGTFNVAGHSADLLFSTVDMTDMNGSNGSTSSSTFSFDQGNLTVTTFNIGTRSSASTGTAKAAATVNIGGNASATYNATLGSVAIARQNSTAGTITGALNIKAGDTGSTANITSLTVASDTAATGGTATGTVTISGGNTTITNGITLADCTSAGTVNGTLVISGGNLTVGGDIVTTGTGGTVTSNVTLSGGTLNMNSHDIGANGGTQISTFNYQSGTLSNPGKIRSNAFVYNSTGNYTFSDILTGTGSVNKQGTGTMTLAGTNDYTGNTTVSAGELDLNSSTSQAIAGNLTVSGGIAKLLQSTQIATGKNLAVSSGTFNIQGFNQTLANVQLTGTGAITGTGNLTSTNAFDMQAGSAGAILAGSVGLNKTTSGTVTLTGNNTYSGNTTIAAGTLSVNNVATGSTGQALGTGTVLDLGVVSTSSGTLLYTGGSSTFGKSINALGNGGDTIQNTGSGTLTLNGTITNTGTTLTLKGGNGITVSGTGTITGSGGNLIIDGGTTTLGSSNTYNGSTSIVNGATLNANVANALPTSNGRSAVLMDQTGTGSSTLALGADQSIASLTGNASSTVNLGSNQLTVGASSGSTTYAGSIHGVGGSLKKDDASTFLLAGTNDYSGPTYVSSGTLIIASTGSITSSANVTTGGTLTVNYGGTAGSISLNGGYANINGSAGTVAVNSGGTLTGSGSAGAVTVASGGILAPGNAGSTAFTVSSLALESGSTTKMVISNATTYDRIAINGALALGGNLTLDINSYLDSYTTTATLFSGFTSLTGNFDSVTSNGTYTAYNGTWTQSVAGKPYLWTWNTGPSGIGTNPLDPQLLTFNTVTGQLTVVPEPQTWVLVGIGFTFMLYRRRFGRMSSARPPRDDEE